MPGVMEMVNDARARAAEPVRVPWRAAVRGFVVGFLAAVLPAVLVTRVVASQLPLAEAVVRGDTAFAFAAFLAVCVGIAVGVGQAAKAFSEDA